MSFFLTHRYSHSYYSSLTCVKTVLVLNEKLVLCECFQDLFV